MKKKLIFLLGLFLAFNSFADSYQIVDVDFNVTGITRPSVLKTAVPLNYSRIFESEEEFAKYIEDYKQRLDNTRCFEEYNVDYTISIPDENGLSYVTLLVTTKDAKHFLGLPYPKFSPSGDNGYLFNVKLKLKDSNFLGSLKEMGTDINLEIDTNDDPVSFKLGTTVYFDTPFNIGNVKCNWTNNHTVSYTFGQDTPEWNLKTGLEFEYPFELFGINLSFYQSFVRDLDYRSKTIEGHTFTNDDTYFIEDVNLSTPIVIQDIIGWGKIYYTPYLNFVYNWDFDGISIYNTDLIGPAVTVGQKVSTSRINWYNNFRNGFDLSMTQSFKYNFGQDNIVPGINISFVAHKAFKYVGFSTNINAFAYLNGNSKFGDKLRGVRDEQYFSSDLTKGGKDWATTYACESPGGIVFNFDLPIHIVSIYWDQLPGFKKIPHIGIFNLELQLSPFIDIGLYHNNYTERTLSLKDGFYCGGLEVLVFPLKWKGFVVRASLGIDLSKKMPVLKDKVDQEWRSKTVSSTEISIGLGYQY